MKRNNKIVVICGPTATGKSALAVSIAKQFSGEVISADSRQVYRGLTIGSAKITPAEMEGVLHHLIDIADPRSLFTVSEYKKLAQEKILDILSRRKLPIICGGSGLYISAVVDNQSFPEVAPNDALRKTLTDQSNDKLFAQLLTLDPARAATIERNNPHRLIRAIEIALSQKPSAQEPLHNPIGECEFLFIGLTIPKEELMQRISDRITNRIPALFDEINSLHTQGISWERLDSFGLEYRYGSQYLQNLISLETFHELLTTKTWQYVRRQMTWFKRDARITWFNPLTDNNAIVNLVQEFLGK